MAENADPLPWPPVYSEYVSDCCGYDIMTCDHPLYIIVDFYKSENVSVIIYWCRCRKFKTGGHCHWFHISSNCDNFISSNTIIEKSSYLSSFLIFLLSSSSGGLRTLWRTTGSLQPFSKCLGNCSPLCSWAQSCWNCVSSVGINWG